MISDWPALTALALSPGLPRVTLKHPWGREALKAHGKMWCWWSPYADAAVFRADRNEREMLIEADPDTFFLHPHYLNPALVLVRAGQIDPAWAAARLTMDWRAFAPKRVLRDWHTAQAGA